MASQAARFMEEFNHGVEYVDPEQIDATGITAEAVRQWRCANDLLDRNEDLFYHILCTHFEKMAPIVYTPVVGWAAVNFHKIYRRPRGLYVSAEDAGCISTCVWNWPQRDVDAIVLTDGSRILGLGDLGANGLAIPIGKLNLYVAGAGFNPSRVLPIVLDVGTDNADLRADPAYMGLRRRRLRGDDLFELLDELVIALTTRWPRAVLQFEDFETSSALPALQRYRDHHLTFNDDVQGTAATVVAGMYGALRAKDAAASPADIVRQKFVVAGAGSAAMGVVNMLKSAMIKHGASPAAAAAAFHILDERGLITTERTGLSPVVAPFARPAGGGDVEGEKLASVVSRVAPDVIIGLAGAGRLFTMPLLADLASRVATPIVFALSNPTAKMECLASEAQAATGGRAIYASGSPQADVETVNGRRASTQANNVHIFPGLALGAHLANARVVTDGMLMAAAEALPPLVDESDRLAGGCYPPVNRIRRTSQAVAAAVIEAAAEEGCLRSESAARALDRGHDALESHIARRMYVPSYSPIVKLPRGVME